MCKFVKTESEVKDYLFKKQQQEREERINSIRMQCYFEVFTYSPIRKLIGSTRCDCIEITEKDLIDCLNQELIAKV